MRAPIFSLLLLLLPPLSKASFHSSNPVATEVQKDSKLPAERFPRSTKQDCPCEGHQKHQRQSCLRFLKQCQLRDITLPL
ncbi:C-X-C motif chemokine 17 isoform X2 [Macrotis lagotis]|uniref:C-X-C motif chemokine 17 isoform X2 n=1 Tax=Macrotis lagotis TaxID=92651 RepID=UPI003D69456F